jgi:hypothetical protein
MQLWTKSVKNKISELTRCDICNAIISETAETFVRQNRQIPVFCEELCAVH